MNRTDVVIGMKVVPHKKSIGISLRQSNAYKAMKSIHQPFLYVAHQHAQDRDVSDKFMLTDDKRQIYICGDYFLCSDFEPYIEKSSLKGEKHG